MGKLWLDTYILIRGGSYSLVIATLVNKITNVILCFDRPCHPEYKTERRGYFPQWSLDKPFKNSSNLILFGSWTQTGKMWKVNENI